MKTKAAVCRAWAEPLTIEELELESPRKRKCSSRWPTPLLPFRPERLEGDLRVDILPCVAGMKRPAWWKRSVPGSPRSNRDHVVSCWQHLRKMRELCEWEHPHLRQPAGRSGTGKLLDGTARFKDAKAKSSTTRFMCPVSANTLYLRKSRRLRSPGNFHWTRPAFSVAVWDRLGGGEPLAQVKTGESVAIWGMGGSFEYRPRGPLAGANPIIAVDLEGSKEKIAREMGHPFHKQQ